MEQNMLQSFLQELSDPTVKAMYAAEVRKMVEQWDDFVMECAEGEMSPHKKAETDFPAHRRQSILEYRGIRVLRWVQQQGVVFHPGKQEREIAKRYLRDMPRVFPELVRQINAIYLFEMGRQKTELLRKCDGILWRDVTLDGFGTLYAVGISLEAIERGREYTQFLFLHELVHVQTGGDHGPEFHKCLDSLIKRFNRYTGSHIINDYCEQP